MRELPRESCGANTAATLFRCCLPAVPPLAASWPPPEQQGKSVPAPPGEAVASSLPPPATWYRVAYSGGISVRVAPRADAPLAGEVLPCNRIFAVSEATPCADGRLYLRLADGSGWVFDDAMLFPHDPSVVMGHWAPSVGSLPPCGGCVQEVALSTPAPLPPLGGAYGGGAPTLIGAYDAGAAAAAAGAALGGVIDRQAMPRRWFRGKRGGSKKSKPH